MPGAAATIGSNHVCPMCTGTTPHVGGPISGPGVSTVLIGGKPAAVMGDMCVCIGPPDVIVTGVANVLIGGKSAVTVGDMTAHGGTIMVGDPTVLIGTSQAVPTAVMPIQDIPFPEITTSDRRAARRTGHDLTEAENNQSEIKKQAGVKEEGEPRIFNLKWIENKNSARKSKKQRVLVLKGNTSNIEDGTSITVQVKIPAFLDQEEKTLGLTGTVSDKVFEATWEIEDL